MIADEMCVFQYVRIERISGYCGFLTTQFSTVWFRIPYSISPLFILTKVILDHIEQFQDTFLTVSFCSNSASVRVVYGYSFAGRGVLFSMVCCS